VFVTTAYLDEAERCNRVGLMNEGRMIRCASPKDLKRSLEEACYEVHTSDQRVARGILQSMPGVLAVEAYGAKLHVFLSPGGASPEKITDALLRSPSDRRISPNRSVTGRCIHHW
jgi:ABC-2 type transport system ATP-binding protein